MEDPLAAALLISSVAGWGVAVVAGLALMPKRRTDISLARLWLDGLRWFRRDTFRPEAHGLWRVFLAGWLTFFAGLLAVALRTLLAA